MQIKTYINKCLNAKISDLALVIISSVILVIFYNLRTVESRLFLYLEDHSLVKEISFLLEIIFNILAVIIFFLLFSFNKTLLKSLLIIFFLLSTIYFYILRKFGIIFDEIMIANAFDSVGHAAEVVDYLFIGYFIILAVFPIFIIAKIKIHNFGNIKKLLIIILCLVLIGLIYLFSPKQDIKRISVIYSPINYIGSFYKYYDRFYKQLKQTEHRVDLDKYYNFKYDKKIDNLNIVLIIGESLRADHLGINGYYRNTTPNLEKIPNLLKFVVAASFNTTTRSVTSMLSHRTKADFIDIPPEKSVVSVFKNLGFDSHWYSAQSSKEFGNGMLTAMAHETEDYFFVDKIKTSLKVGEKPYDETLIPYLKKALGNNNTNFVVLHSFGSHIRFSERYPENFSIYQPECLHLPNSCKREEVENSYDNSVLYTDYFISQVIDTIKDTNTILFYVSDHGIFLGEDNVYANGNSDQAGNKVHQVPMLLYMTNSVLQNKFYKNKFVNAKTQITSNKLSHDNLFDSILDCTGIESDLLKRNLSICGKLK